MKRKLIGLFFAGALAFNAAAAEVYINIAPPRAVVERRGPAPGRGYVWIPGYYRWDGHAHIWVAGSWDRPPRARAHWEAHRWVHQKGGWVFVEGHWR